MLTFLQNAIANYKTSVLGFVIAGAGYEAGLHGPHVAFWTTVGSIATILLGMGAADATAAKDATK
jgi:hypothetical protein